MTTSLRTPESDSESWPDRFVSSKTDGQVINVGHAALFDFLVCATLDPDVWSLEPADPIEVSVLGATVVHRPDVVVRRQSGMSIVDVRPRGEYRRTLYAAVEATLRARGARYQLRHVEHAELVARARTVWACRDAEVTPGDQVRVLSYLDRVGSAPIGKVERVLKAAAEPRSAIYALFCWDILEADLFFGLCAETPVRRRTRKPP
jgi:hypothetical protein